MRDFEFVSCGESDTIRLAKKIADIAKRQDIFALYGTLGMGKSVFSRAFIQHLTGAQDVPSPTFTLLQVYEAKDFDIYHYDMYRIKSPEEVFELGIEDAFYQGVSLIEWPEKMEKYLPARAIRIKMQSIDENTRRIMISSENADWLRRIKTIEKTI